MPADSADTTGAVPVSTGRRASVQPGRSVGRLDRRASLTRRSAKRYACGSVFTPTTRMSLARFRLRFLLQEIDLPQGDTVIGRSATCQVTIEDPLVSREHAKIRIQDERATIEDLGSRNDVFVGGSPVQGRRDLQ